MSTIEELLPDDTNLYYANLHGDEGYLYFADPQPSENGENRVVRVNYFDMDFTKGVDDITLGDRGYLLPGNTHSNPHSVDRAGKTNKFYVRTQNSYSFDVIKVVNGKMVLDKVVPLTAYIDGKLVQYSPRAFGAYNAKYNVQLLSGRNSPGYTIVGIVDVATDVVTRTVTSPIRLVGGSSSTGHAEWLDTENFAVIDRGNRRIKTYTVFINSIGDLDFKATGTMSTGAGTHSIERVQDSTGIPEDLNTFYSLGESIVINGNQHHPFVSKMLFDPLLADLVIPTSSDIIPKPLVATFYDTDYDGLEEMNVPATTHHINITKDRKYLIVPVYDGKVYKIDRVTMEILDVIDTGVYYGLGAAHVELSESLGLALVTNHWSPYVTILDVSNDGFKLLGYIKVYRDGHHDRHNPDEKHLMQPHFAQVDETGKFFYTFASQDNGRFVRVDLEEMLKLDVIGSVYQFDNNDDNGPVMVSVDVGGAPEQAHS